MYLLAEPPSCRLWRMTLLTRAGTVRWPQQKGQARL